jgi:protein Tex
LSNSLFFILIILENLRNIVQLTISMEKIICIFFTIFVQIFFPMLDINIEKMVFELGLSMRQIQNTLKLFEEGATVPFIARYRKEVTGGLDEVMIIRIRDLHTRLVELEKRRQSILESIREQEKLTPDLEAQILKTDHLAELEDLYLPYRPKRKTRASVAREKGLEPLALFLLKQLNSDPETEAAKFVNSEKSVDTIEDALSGARDIIAEMINEDANLRRSLRTLFKSKAIITSAVIKSKAEEGNKYENYFKWSEPLSKAPSHRVLAVFRGENEGFLKVTISPPPDDAIQLIEKRYLRMRNACGLHVADSCTDGWKRLLQPSLETEMRNEAKEIADTGAIQVFVENLRQLLMQPPLGQKRILALDPGFRTGCKLVVLNELGQLLHNETIYPHPPEMEVKQSINKLIQLVDSFKIEAIAIGNGTAGRETEQLVKNIRFNRDVIAVMVNESGASVYSASSVAREEFPDYDVTVRGAVSIGRRLMDPLAELVKIDPKSIGVGQYQHDVDQKALQKSLEETVVSCVNKVGVELNSASKELLTHVSGIGPALAKSIVEFRNENGKFAKREQLLKVPRFGDKAFQQAAGFLRIKDGDNPLDSTAVHPESYYIVKKMMQSLQIQLDELLREKDRKKKFLDFLKPEDFTDEKAGLPTITDILQELDKPGRDPREGFDLFEFDETIRDIEDLHEGMILPGIITNITAFGAFVDIGLHEAGLVHISQLSDKYVKDPNDVVKINQKVQVKVVSVDLKRRRIQLTMKGL